MPIKRETFPLKLNILSTQPLRLTFAPTAAGADGLRNGHYV